MIDLNKFVEVNFKMKKRIESITRDLISKNGYDNVTKVMDAVVITNRYQKTAGDLEKLQYWEDKELNAYMNKYKIIRDEANHNINVIRKAQNLKIVELPYYLGMTSIDDEHNHYKQLRRQLIENEKNYKS